MNTTNKISFSQNCLLVSWRLPAIFRHFLVASNVLKSNFSQEMLFHSSPLRQQLHWMAHHHKIFFIEKSKKKKKKKKTSGQLHD